CGHADDCDYGAINDVGLLARIQGGVRGFQVKVGGGLSTSPEDAHLLFDFLPADELLPVCEALVRLFDRTGNRQNKARARIKYVIRKFGWDETRRMILDEIAELQGQGRGRMPIDPEPAAKLARPRLPVLSLASGPPDPELLRFIET